MDNSFFAYLQQLEILAFFSGYPLLYAAVMVFAGNRASRPVSKQRIVSLLPFVYVICGLLYAGLCLKNLYPDFSIDNIRKNLYHPFFVIWGLSSLLFILPFLRSKPVFSLLHSLVLFFPLLKDVINTTLDKTEGAHTVKNDMKVYTTSLLLNAAIFIILILISLLIRKFSEKKKQ